MSIVLRRLEERGARDPIRVGLIGAGYAGRAFAARILGGLPWIRLVAIANRTPEAAVRAYADAGVEDVVSVESPAALRAAMDAGRAAITTDATLLTDADGVEAIVEATGDVEFGATVALRAIAAGKHLVLVNAELDATLGPILRVRADAAGVVLTDMAGDQPGVLMDLVNEVRLLGLRPFVAGNVKTLLDHYRTPETQRAFAEATGQRATMVTSFVDGTKLAAEMTVVANATGFGVAARGMLGPRAARIEEAVDRFATVASPDRPIVDYLLGAEPSFGVFVLGWEDRPAVRRYLAAYRMGDGPAYLVHRPFHVGPLETHVSVARAVLLADPVITPLGGPVCEVVAIAKRDLHAGETLDGIGGYTVYGTIEGSGAARREGLLPWGSRTGACCSATSPATARSGSRTSGCPKRARRSTCGGSSTGTSPPRIRAAPDGCPGRGCGGRSTGPRSPRPAMPMRPATRPERPPGDPPAATGAPRARGAPRG